MTKTFSFLLFFYFSEKTLAIERFLDRNDEDVRKRKMKVKGMKVAARIIESIQKARSHFQETLRTDKKIIFMGMGNDIMGDDQVGTYIVNVLKRRVNHPPEGWMFLDVNVVPDNYMGKIIHFAPDVLVIFDAYRKPFFEEKSTESDASSNPSSPRIILLDSLEVLPDGFTTHDISLENYVRFIEFHCQKRIDVQFWGIRGENFEFGNEQMTMAVKNAADMIIEAFLIAWNELNVTKDSRNS